MLSKTDWVNLRYEEMEDKTENMGFTFSKPVMEDGTYLAGEDAYVHSISERLARHLDKQIEKM